MFVYYNLYMGGRASKESLLKPCLSHSTSRNICSMVPFRQRTMVWTNSVFVHWLKTMLSANQTLKMLDRIMKRIIYINVEIR